MRKLVGKINSATITIILIAFYFLGMGAASILWRLSRVFRMKNKNSYWEKSRVYKQADFLSPY